MVTSRKAHISSAKTAPARQSEAMRDATRSNGVRRVLRPLSVFIFMALFNARMSCAQEETVQFNTDVLDVKDRENIDLNRFSQAGYVMPGQYQFTVRINKTELPEENITFMAPDNNPKGSEACLPPELVDKLGLTDHARRGLRWWHDNQCLDMTSLEGMTAQADLGSGVLNVNIPQVYLEYTSENWDPPSRWDDGIAGVLFDYDLNAMSSRQSKSGRQDDISANGVTGVNMGPWRFRADWQAQYNSDRYSSSHDMQWSRYYLYRAIKSLRAKLIMGESNLNSAMFDGFRFTGASLATDDAQLPPNLRGYAPEVSGVAKTNAKVTISQKDQVIYETTVAAGPFRIQDLSDVVSGKLDVKVQEQDGSVQRWQVDTASIPYLSRPGSVRYKVSAGEPSDYKHHREGEKFATSEFSWGVSNGWSLYGGGLFSEHYNQLAMGFGRDLLALGAVSVDISHSNAQLPDEGTKQGNSYRVSYSKHFNEYNSQITFAGYRFSERDFMNMSQFLDSRYHSAQSSGNSKEMYTISLDKQFPSLNLSTYLNYSHETYWDRAPSDTWNASLSSYFDVGDVKNISASLSFSRNQLDGKKDDSVYVSFSVPWGEVGNIDYGGQFGSGKNSHSVGFYNRIDPNNSYRISAGATSGGEGSVSGYFMHDGSIAQVTANASVNGSDYQGVGFSMQGGATATRHGVALHRVSGMGGTRMMVDTGGVSGVPLHGYGPTITSNYFGKAVVTDISSYYRSSIDIDLTKLPDNVDSLRSVIEDTMTEGAIGYRKFSVLAGQKSMAIIKLPNGKTPPFGAVVTNSDNMQTGITDDGGSVWLSGMNPGETMDVHWGGELQCRIHLPSVLKTDLSQQLFLPCEPVSDKKAPATETVPATSPSEQAETYKANAGEVVQPEG